MRFYTSYILGVFFLCITSCSPPARFTKQKFTSLKQIKVVHEVNEELIDDDLSVLEIDKEDTERQNSCGISPLIINDSIPSKQKKNSLIFNDPVAGRIKNLMASDSMMVLITPKGKFALKEPNLSEDNYVVEGKIELMREDAVQEARTEIYVDGFERQPWNLIQFDVEKISRFQAYDQQNNLVEESDVKPLKKWEKEKLIKANDRYRRLIKMGLIGVLIAAFSILGILIFDIEFILVSFLIYIIAMLIMISGVWSMQRLKRASERGTISETEEEEEYRQLIWGLVIIFSLVLFLAPLLFTAIGLGVDKAIEKKKI